MRPVASHGDLDVVELPALLARADEVLEAVLGPLDGPAEPHRRVRDQDLLGIEEHDLRAEAAADVRRDRPPPGTPGSPKIRASPFLMGSGACVEVHTRSCAGARVVLGHDAARLDRAAAAPLDDEPLAEHVRGLREGRVRVPHALDDAGGAVPGDVRVDQGRPGWPRRLERR